MDRPDPSFPARCGDLGCERLIGLKVEQYRKPERSSPIMIGRGVSLRSLLESFLAQLLSWLQRHRALSLNSGDGLAAHEAAALRLTSIPSLNVRPRTSFGN